MEKQAAVEQIFDKVYTPVFIEKCASLGIHFQDQEELDSALTSAALVKQASAELAAAQPAQPSVIKQAALDLATSLSGAPEQPINDNLSEAFQSVGGA